MRKLAVILAFLLFLVPGGAGAPKKYIALTFDDGPTGQYTARLLDVLAQRQVQATFFLCGYRVQQYPELTARIAEQGHEIALHGLAHTDFSKTDAEALREELTQESFLIAEASGYAAKLVRPPGGRLPEQAQRAPLEEFAVVLWSVDPKDWATDDRAAIVRCVVRDVQPGDIILMHDASDSSVDAAADIIDRLQQEGYTFVTVSALAAACGTPLEAGCIYHRFGT